MARLALAFGSGLAGAALLPDPRAASALLLTLPIAAFLRPDLVRRRTAAAAVALAAGLGAGVSARVPPVPPCLVSRADGAAVRLDGVFLGLPGRGRVPFRVDAAGGCGGTVLALLGDEVDPPLPGAPLTLEGAWLGPRTGGRGSGVVLVDELTPRAGAPGGPWLLKLRGRVQERIRGLFGDSAPLAEALVLARKEALDPDVRAGFTASGTAHLLAISGFHVGVVAALLFTLARRLGLARGPAGLWAAAASWSYVLAIGAPDAATRAALLITLLVVSRARGRSLHPLGALGTAFLLMAATDPGAPESVGFQLSFAGAGGLVVLRPGVRAWLSGDRRPAVPPLLVGPLASGIAATVATLPLVAWHFGRISLVGIPATLVLAPVVAMAIPGIFASVLLSWLWSGAGSWLAAGTAVLLDATAAGASFFGSLPGAVQWVPRAWLVWAGSGAAATLAVTGGRRDPGRKARYGAAAMVAAAALVAAPLLDGAVGRGTVEMVFLDVGQGDAVLVRSPGGRWILVDTGPGGRGADAGARTILPYLRRRGVGELELLLLTHPDLDHIGGAASVLEGVPVRAVADPGLAAAKESYVEVLASARERGVPWWRATAGHSVVLDGLTLEVLHPFQPTPGSEPSGGLEANDLSVVVELRFGDFRAFLAGDAPAEVERAVLETRTPGTVELLKVGHHGSRTSTDTGLLARLQPVVAVVSVGRRNRYGHPHDVVLERLRRAGARILRTDRHGHVRVRARADGSFDVVEP